MQLHDRVSAEGAERDEASSELDATALTWGLLQPRWSPEAGLEALRAWGPERVAALLVRHKVSGIAQRVAERYSASATNEVAALLAHLRSLSAPAQRRRDTLEDTLRLIEQACGDDVRCWPMKGVSMEARYPAGVPRHIGDIDLQVSDVDDMWTLSQRLTRYGYVYSDAELPWFKRDVVSGSYYGQVRLVVPDRSRMSIDIHGGWYSVRHCGLLPAPTYLGGPADALPSAEDDLSAAIVNAAGDHAVQAKLINDLVVLLGGPLDHAMVVGQLAEAGLLPFLALVLTHVLAWCDLTDTQRGKLDLLMPDTAAEPAPPLDRDAPQMRAAVTVRHTADLAPSLCDGDADAAQRIVDGAEEAYRTERPLRLTDAPPLTLGPQTLNNWTCIRLVPVPLLASSVTPGRAAPADSDEAVPSWSLTRQLAVVATPEGPLVRAGHELFVPTVDFAVRDTLARYAVRNSPA